MKVPSISLVGDVTSLTARGSVVIMNLACEIDKKDDTELMTFPITFFGDHAQNLYVKTPTGTRIEITCFVKTWTSPDGKVFVNLNGGEYKVIRGAIQAPPPQVTEEIEEDLPF